MENSADFQAFIQRKLSGETPTFKIVGVHAVTGDKVDYKLDRYPDCETYCCEEDAQRKCDELNKTAINGVWSPVKMSMAEIQKHYARYSS